MKKERNIIKKRNDIFIEHVLESLTKLDIKKRIKFIILFGSTARGKNNILSDVDIAVYYNGSDNERFKFRITALGNLPDNIDLQIFQDLPLTVQKEVLAGTVLYYDNYNFMFDTLMNVMKEFNGFEKYYEEYFQILEERILT